MVPRIELAGVGVDFSVVGVDARLYPLPPGIARIRFETALFFANTRFFEDSVPTLERSHPALSLILVDVRGINMPYASAVETLRALLRDSQDSGTTSSTVAQSIPCWKRPNARA